MSKREQVYAKAVDCLKLAEDLYGVDTSAVAIKFDLKGAAAGMACYEKRGSHTRTWMRFNTQMIETGNFDHILNDTVPHEVAHIVGFLNPRLARGHNAGWRRVCIELGGTGKTRHDEDVIYAKGRTYQYTCTQGTTVNISEQRHNKIQQGKSYRLKKGGWINQFCDHQVVGIAGQPITTTQPETQAAEKPAQPTKPAPKLNDKKLSKADRVRAAIARAKEQDLERVVVVEWAMDELGMQRSQARKYVNENWSKV